MRSIQVRPGALAPLFESLAAQGVAKMAAGLVETGDAVERQAKTNASNGAHAYRTPTPSPGDPQGPAIISAALVDSITHTGPTPTGSASWEVRVGMAPGRYPWYSSRTPTSRYAYYLEVTGAGKSHHRFPFLVPALHMAGTVAVYTAFSRSFSTGWR